MILVICRDIRLICALESYYNYEINNKILRISYQNIDGDYTQKIYLENYIDLSYAINQIDSRFVH